MRTWNFGSASPILVTPFELASVGHVSYLLVDTASGVAAVVDPRPDVEPYLEAAGRACARIRHVFLTKLHSDFEGGHLALARRCGAVVYAGAEARPAFPHLPVKDGDALQFGSTGLTILETPGHTLEGITILASDISRSGAPWGMFGGDLLFEGDLGRPEPRLGEGVSAVDLAGLLLASIRRKILTLPAGVRVFTGHRTGTGEASRRSGRPPTLGGYRRTHPLLRPMADDAFIRTVTAGMLPAPPSRGTLNRGALPKALSAGVFLALLQGGMIALDLREPMEFAAGHVPGSLSLGLGAGFEDWASSVLDPTEDYLLVANPGSEEEGASRLRPLLGSRVRGFLAGGMTALEPRPGLLERSTHALIPSGARGPLAARVDVRAASAGGEEAGRRLPLEELLGRLGELPVRRGRLAVIDEDPYRAHSAASLLRRRGWSDARPLIACDPAAP